MTRKLTDMAAAVLLLVLLLGIGLVNLAGRLAWTASRWPRRGRTSGAKREGSSHGNPG